MIKSTKKSILKTTKRTKEGKRFDLGNSTYDGYEGKSIPLPVAAHTEI